jgi:undecaprenyl-diphosphatase
LRSGAGAGAWFSGPLGLLIGLSVVAGLLVAFIALTGEVMEGDTLAFDRSVLLALRSAADPNQPAGPWWMARMVRDLTALGSVSVLSLGSLVALGGFLLMRRWASALLLALSVSGGMAISFGLKQWVDRARPDLAPHGDVVLTASFPSGHAMLSTVVGLTLGALLAQSVGARRLKLYIMAVAVLLSLMIGASRVYLGVHWPTDVLAGWSVGAAWVALCWILAEGLRRHGGFRL